MSEPQLAVSTNSWHYRHYCRILRLYGCDVPTSKKTSLCPYVQTMIWGSLFFAVTLPIQLLGWVFMKGCRLLYKGLVRIGAYRLVDCIDSHKVGTWLANSADNLKVEPVLTAFAWGIACLMLGVSTLLIVAIFSIGVWQLLLTIPYIPALLWLGVKYVGWGVVWVGWAFIQAAIWMAWLFWMALYWIGFGIITAAACCIDSFLWLLTAGWLWLGLLKWTAIILGSFAMIFAVTWLILWAFNTKAGQGLIDWLSMKFNGYKEARAIAVEHRHKSRPKPKVEKKEVERKPSWICQCAENFGNWLSANVGMPIHNFFVSTKGSIEGKQVKVLSGFAAIGAFLWAVKHQMCPIVTFVAPGEVEAPIKDENKDGQSPSRPAVSDAAAERPEDVNAEEGAKD